MFRVWVQTEELEEDGADADDQVGEACRGLWTGFRVLGV